MKPIPGSKHMEEIPNDYHETAVRNHKIRLKQRTPVNRDAYEVKC